jgi:uncharacterized protein
VRSRPVDLRMCLITSATAVATGVASGFFGIGGGFLIVPALVLATGMPTTGAVGSSLLAVGTFGLATALDYAWSGLVDWPLAVEFIGGGILGGIGGMLLATRLAASKTALTRIFAALGLIVAAYVIVRNAPHEHNIAVQYKELGAARWRPLHWEPKDNAILTLDLQK